MSQYVEEFENHAFHQTWADLKVKLDAVVLDANADNIDKEKVARLKKVVAFIEDILEQLDPELFPMAILNSLNKQAVECRNQINHFNSNRNIGHIGNANNNIDSVLTQVKPYIFYGDKLKKSLRSAIRAYIGEMDKHLENIADTKSEYDKAVEYRQEIENYRKILLLDDDEESIRTRISKVLEDIEEKYRKLNSFYNETLIDDESESTKTAVVEAKKDVLRDAKEAKEKLIEISNKIEDLEKFYVKIYGEYDEENDKRIGGLDQKVHQLHAELELFKNKQEDSYTNLISEKTIMFDTYEKEQKQKYNSLYSEIERLLPGATSAGLAKAYSDMRTSFTIPIIMWNIVFIAALVGMFYGGYKTLGASTDWKETLNHLLHYAPLYVPAVWLAIFASKRRSENKRLAQEYAHKEAVAKSYASYKQQIEELSEEDQKLILKLIDSAIDTVSYNPSETLGKKHEDDMPIKELSKTLLESFGKIVDKLKIEK